MNSTWHFKKWFQHIVEFITATCMVILMGISDMDFSSPISYVIIFALAFGFISGIYSLKLYGRYEDDDDED